MCTSVVRRCDGAETFLPLRTITMGYQRERTKTAIGVVNYLQCPTMTPRILGHEDEIPRYRTSNRREAQQSAKANEALSVRAIQACDGKDAWATDNLEFHGLAVQLDRPNLEVDANSADIAFCVRVVGETQEKAGLRAKGCS